MLLAAVREQEANPMSAKPDFYVVLVNKPGLRPYQLCRV